MSSPALHLTSSAYPPQFGARIESNGLVRFRLWAPEHAHIVLVLEAHESSVPKASEIVMRAAGGGWHEITTDRARAGSRYRYRLPDGTCVPDPASCFQPDDVKGPSEVIDHAAFVWHDSSWRGRPWHTAVLYELHVGAFTPEGTFAAATARLKHLARLGVTAIELMPLADFPGQYNWGYDGVLPYAPDSTYGRPEDLKAFIDAAHALGLMVLLDVVYNHFGPEGNYLGSYAPEFFTERHHTPWGAAINFDGAHARSVREFFIENALYWLEDFHFDGLRLDAVHHLIDESDTHILTELASTVRNRFPHREIHLLLENEENQASRLERSSDRRPRHFTAQWNDDAHHVLHTAATGERHGYYGDYVGDEHKLVRALTEGFAFQGEVMEFRGSARGEPSAHLPPEAFVTFIQNHDQIGNRAFGERLAELAPVQARRALSAIYLLLPQVPMLFMGEEWDSDAPFVFFCDFKGELADQIREGRRKEFSAFPAFAERHEGRALPDPDARSTFESAKLDWHELETLKGQLWLDRYRALLEVRHRETVPRIPLILPQATRSHRLGAFAFRVTWRVGRAENLTLTANLSSVAVPCPDPIRGRIVWAEGLPPTEFLEPWAVIWSVASIE